MDKQLEKFLIAITQLAPTEFIGLAKYLKVPITIGITAEPRDAMDITADIVEAFSNKNRLKRREILRMVQLSRRDNNGSKA